MEKINASRTELESVIDSLNANISDYSSYSDNIGRKICKIKTMPIQESGPIDEKSLDPCDFIGKLHMANERFAKLNEYMSKLTMHASEII